MGQAVKHSMLYALSLAVSKGISLLMLPWLANHLSVTQFGTLELISLFISIGSVAFAFSMTEALYRFASSENSHERVHFLWHRVQALTLAGLILCAVLVAGSAGSDWQIWIALAGITTVLEGLISFPLAWLRLQDRSSAFVTICLSKVCVQTLATVWFVYSGFGISGILLAGLIATLFQAACLQFQIQAVRRHKPTPIAGWIQYCGPLTGSGLLAIALFGVERAYIGHFDSVAEVGLYAVAAKFGLALALMMQPFGMWFFPKRAPWAETDSALLRRKTQLGIALLALFSAGALVIVPLFVSWFLPVEYHGAMAYLPPAVLAMAAKEYAELTNFGLWRDHPKTLLSINLACAALALLTMAAAGYLWKGLGVAYALACISSFRAAWIAIRANRYWRLQVGTATFWAGLAVLTLAGFGRSIEPQWLTMAVALVVLLTLVASKVILGTRRAIAA